MKLQPVFPSIATLNSDLVAWYSCQTAHTSRLYDSSHYRHNGTIPDDPYDLFETTHRLWALKLAMEYCEVADAPQLNLSDELTVAAWVNLSSISAEKTIVCKGITSDSAQVNYRLKITTANKLQFTYRDDGDTANHIYTSDNAVISATNTWYHVAATFYYVDDAYSGGGFVTLYVNGAPVAGNWTTGDGQALPLQTTQSLKIGGLDAASPEYFTGWLNQIRIYKRALTDAEIGQLAALPADSLIRSFDYALLSVETEEEEGPLTGDEVIIDDSIRSGISENQRKICRTGDGQYWVTWVEVDGATYYVKASRSWDKGATWHHETVATAAFTANPEILIDSRGYVHVFWIHFVSGATYILKHSWRVDSSADWSTNQENCTTASDWSLGSPSVSVDSDDTLHMVWLGASAIQYSSKSLVETAADWQTNRVQIADESDRSYGRPQIAIGPDDELHVVWNASATDGFTRYVEYSHKGNTADNADWATNFETVKTDSVTGGFLVGSRIAVDSSGYPHVTWGENLDGAADQQVFYSKRTGSNNWSSNAVQVSNAGVQAYPSIAVDAEDTAHIAWYGRASGSINQVRYSKSPDWTITDLTAYEDSDPQARWAFLPWAYHPRVCSSSPQLFTSGVAVLFEEDVSANPDTLKLWQADNLEWDIPHCPLTLGGSALCNVSNPEVFGSGGLTLSGSAICGRVFEQEAIGSLFLSGSAACGVKLSAIGSGSLLLDGESQPRTEFTVIAGNPVFKNGFAFRRPVYANVVDESLPVLVSTTLDAENITPYGVGFETLSGSALDFDLDSGSSTFAAWVKFSSAGEHTFWLYYGKTTSIDPSDNTVFGDLVSVLHMEEEASAVAGEFVDTMGNNSGTSPSNSTNRPSRITGIAGKAQSFQGNDWIYFGTDAFLDSDDLTVSAWVRLSALPNQRRIVFSRGATASGYSWNYQLGLDELGRVYCAVKTTESGWTVHSVTGSTAITLNTWFHIAGVWESGVGLRVYRNGVLDGTVSTVADELAPSLVGWNIGRVDNGNYFAGDIDEVRVINEARADLLTEYQSVGLAIVGDERRAFNLSGSAPLKVNRLIAGLGSIALSGTATVRASLAAEATGGLALAGEAIPALRLASFSGLAIGASAAIEITPSPSGSISLSGEAGLVVNRLISGNGSIRLSGEAGVVVNRGSISPAGGLSLAGSATVRLVSLESARAGLEIGAASALSVGLPAGAGLVIGASAAIEITPTPSGRILLAGSATVGLRKIASPSGSISLSGNAGIGIAIAATGGLALAGSAIPALRFAITAEGSLRLAGSTLVNEAQFIEVSSGGLRLAGSSIIKAHYSYTATGGLEINPTGELLDLRTGDLGVLPIFGGELSVKPVFAGELEVMPIFGGRLTM